MLRWVLQTSTSLQYAHGGPVQLKQQDRVPSEQRRRGRVGRGRGRSAEKKCAQMARTTCSGSWKEGSASTSLATAAVPENDTEEPAAGIDCPSAMATGTESASTAPGALLKELFVKRGLVPGGFALGAALLGPSRCRCRPSGGGDWQRPMCTLGSGQSHRLLSLGGSNRWRRSSRLHTSIRERAGQR